MFTLGDNNKTSIYHEKKKSKSICILDASEEPAGRPQAGTEHLQITAW